MIQVNGHVVTISARRIKIPEWEKEPCYINDCLLAVEIGEGGWWLIHNYPSEVARFIRYDAGDFKPMKQAERENVEWLRSVHEYEDRL